MADKSINQLTTASYVNDAGMFVLQQDSASYSITSALLKDYLGTLPVATVAETLSYLGIT